MRPQHQVLRPETVNHHLREHAAKRLNERHVVVPSGWHEQIRTSKSTWHEGVRGQEQDRLLNHQAPATAEKKRTKRPESRSGATRSRTGCCPRRTRWCAAGPRPGKPPALRTGQTPVSYTHLRAHETDSYLVCRLLLEKKKK